MRDMCCYLSDPQWSHLQNGTNAVSSLDWFPPGRWPTCLVWRKRLLFFFLPVWTPVLFIFPPPTSCPKSAAWLLTLPEPSHLPENQSQRDWKPSWIALDSTNSATWAIEEISGFEWWANGFLKKKKSQTQNSTKELKSDAPQITAP